MLLALWKHKPIKLVMIVVGHVVAALLGLIMIALVHQSLFNDGGVSQLPVSIKWIIQHNSIIYLSLLLPLFIISVLSYRLLATLGAGVLYVMRNTMVSQLLALPYQQLESMGGARIQALLTLDVDTISDALRALPMLLFNTALLLCCLGYMLWLSASYFMVYVFVLITIGMCAWWLVKRSESLLTALRESQGSLYQSLAALVAGSKELSLNTTRRHYFEFKEIHVRSAVLRAATIASEKHISIMTNFVTLMIFVMLGILLLLGQSKWAAPDDVMIGFVIMTLFIRGPVLSISANLPVLIKGNVAWQNIERSGLSLDLSSDENDVAKVENESTPFNRLELRDVSFRYASHLDEPSFELGPIQFMLNKGELVFIIGGNGSGKSTLAKVLTGLYEASSGDLLLNDRLFTGSDTLNKLYSSVFFDFQLFSQAIDNEGNEVSDYVLSQWLQRLDLFHKVNIENGKLSTTELSQGQRRRLALIIAYCENRPILLFDEWAADQDPHFRHIFYTELLPYLKSQGKTIVAITHDDRYFDRADKLYKLEEGSLIDITCIDKKSA
jgi:putative ATP-binding cassette transporter